MRILTIATKRSLREIDTHLRKRKHYTTKTYSPGDVIEVIDGNKKSLAVVLKTEAAVKYKQAIRDGSVDIAPLKLSKTGPQAHGIIIAHYPITDIKRYYKDSDAAHASKDKIICDLFPRRRQKKASSSKQARATTDGSLQSLSIERYTDSQSTHHTPLQLFVDEARTYFGETARQGMGSFSYYIGMCKDIPMHDLYQIFGEAKQASHKTTLQKKKLFWWKIGQYKTGGTKSS
jgi:hypothetical protein